MGCGFHGLEKQENSSRCMEGRWCEYAEPKVGDLVKRANSRKNSKLKKKSDIVLKKKISPLLPLWNKNVEVKVRIQDLERKYICGTNIIVMSKTTTTTTTKTEKGEEKSS